MQNQKDQSDKQVEQFKDRSNELNKIVRQLQEENAEKDKRIEELEEELRQLKEDDAAALADLQAKLDEMTA